MPFELTTPQTVTLKAVSIRNEKHGDQDVTAISLGLRATVPNTFLDFLDHRLRHALYMSVPDQEQLPGVEPTTPLLRSNSITTVALKQSYEGWVLEIAHGIEEDEPIMLAGCKVDKWALAPKEGGIVELAFRVSSNDVDPTEIGLIGAKLAQEITIRLLAPALVKPAIDGTQAAFAADHPQAQDATSLFSEQHSVRGDDEGEPAMSDDMGIDSDGDSDGIEPDAGQDDAAAFEAGLTRQISAAGITQKRGGRSANDGKRKAGSA